MLSIKIDLPDATADQLRREAALRNESAEHLAARLLSDQLRSPLPAEFDITDDEIDLIQAEVDAVRESKRSA